MSKHFDITNIINNHVIIITHYQIFVVVYQNTNILKCPHHEEMYDYDIYRKSGIFHLFSKYIKEKFSIGNIHILLA